MKRTMKHEMKIAAHIFLMVCPLLASAQVPVSVAPVAHAQFLSNAGIPLASGCVFTYAAGTTTPQATYTDSTGSATNTNPIILDAGGFANIWLTSQSYKFQVKSAGGVNCATGGTQWTVDGITGQLGLLSLTNIWANQQTFSQPIIITPSVNQIVTGTSPNQTTLNFPAPSGAKTLTFPNTTDTMVGRATTDTLTNKTITNPTLTVGNVQMVNSPATYTIGVNEGTTGTGLGLLVKLSTAATGTVLKPAITDTGGVVGICVAGCGTTSTATIQVNGVLSCVFDGGVTSGDYIQISTTVAGNCHDAGATYPTSGQVIGRVTSTQGGAGTYGMYLFGPEMKAPTTVTITAANLTGQTANIAATPLVTPSANGFYRASCYLVVTTAAGTSSTLPQCQINWTDGDSNVAENSILIAAVTTNTVGATGLLNLGANAPMYYFFAKSGVAITFQTNSYASNPASAMAYAIHVRLEGPF